MVPRAFLIALVAALALAPVAAGSRWRPITPAHAPAATLALTRGFDGTLHVVWDSGGAAIHQTQISLGGRLLGTRHVAAWSGVPGLALLTLPAGGLRLLATRDDPGHVGINVFRAGAQGLSWRLEPGDVWGGTSAGASQSVAAALTPSGVTVSAWPGFVQAGPIAGATGTAVGNQMTTAELATDALTGQVIYGGITLAPPGGYLIAPGVPAIGKAQLIPSLATPGAAGMTARIGAQGVFAATTTGDRVQLSMFGGSTRTLARGRFTVAKAFAASGGRLWLVWGASRARLYVTRSNLSVTRFEPIQRIALPPRAGALVNVAGEGTAGPLDLFADVGRYWHARVLPALTVRVTAGRRVLRVRVGDAGSPVAGAVVTVGRRRVRTSEAGTADLRLARGGRGGRHVVVVVVVVRKAGYARARAMT